MALDKSINTRFAAVKPSIATREKRRNTVFNNVQYNRPRTMLPTAFLLVLLQTLIVTQSQESCLKADVGFVLDRSSSLGEKTYWKALELMNRLVKKFDVKPGCSRAGVVTFSNNATTDIDFDMYDDYKDFNEALNQIPMSGQNTRLDLGLKEATEFLYNFRYFPKFGYRKYLIVLSDGHQSEKKQEKVDIKRLTRFLRHQQVQIISVPLGNYPNLWYMNQLVQNPLREVVFLRQFSKVQKVVRQIYKLAVKKAPTVPLTCTKYADIAFLLDTSSSIRTAKNFRFQTQFVKAVVENFQQYSFNGNSGNIRAAIILYGSTAQLKIKLNEFLSMENFKDALDKRIRFRGQPLTRIDLALNLANYELFQEKNGDRPNVPNYLVLITDGKQNSGSYLTDINIVPRNAAPLWRRNVTIFTVGVGRARRAQLRAIAGKGGGAIYKKSLKDLKEAVDQIVPKQCRGCHARVNLGFVLDASGTTSRYYKTMRELVHYIIEGFKTQKERVEATAIRFSENASVDIHFGQYSDLNSFQVDLDTKMPFLGGATYIHKGLRAAQREFNRGANPDLPKVIILLTDGRQSGNDIETVRKTADDLRKQGFHIFVVAFGPCRSPSCKNKFLAMSGSPQNIYKWKWNHSQNLIEAAERIAKASCP